MMKFENIAEVGQRIRAYDFEPMEGRDEAYAEGTVIEKLEHSYIVRVENDTYAPKGERIEIQVPFQVGFCEYDSRVTLLQG